MSYGGIALLSNGMTLAGLLLIATRDPTICLGVVLVIVGDTLWTECQHRKRESAGSGDSNG